MRVGSGQGSPTRQGVQGTDDGSAVEPRCDERPVVAGPGSLSWSVPCRGREDPTVVVPRVA